MTGRRLELDAESLKALAHPLRVRMLRQLEVRGRASATTLAADLGESTGVTSYHLRQLARHGVVEEFEPENDPDDEPRTGRRPRWWRMAVDQIHITGFAFQTDADTREAYGMLNQAWLADRARRTSHWFATALEWSEPWQHASSDADSVLELDASQTRAFADELAAVVARYSAMPPGPGARKVDVGYAVFPSENGTRA